MEQQQKKRLEYILIGILLIVSLIGSYFGIKLPAPDVPLVAGVPGTRGTISRTGIIDANGDGLVTWNGGTIATYSDAGSTETFSITGSTGAFSTDSTISQTAVNAAGGSANPYDYTGTLGIMNGSDDFTVFDVNVTNANHTGASNTVQALDVAAITGDADATETALKVGDGWDFGADLGNGGLTTTGQAIIGGGYGSTGATVSAAGVGQFNGALTTDGALTADSAAIGGGYGSTGASLSSAGVGQFNGALTTDGTLTAADIAFGGGYGATGCTGSSAGALSCDGLLTGALGATVTGATVSLNASSNFGINLATGTSTGAVAIGGGSGTVAIDTTTWDVSTAGAVTGIGDITAITGLAGGWDVSIAAAAADTAAGTFDVTGQAGGTASADQVGKNGGSLTLTAGAGSAKNGAGATDGNGGDVVLLGGAKGGATAGTEVDGIVRVGNPTVGSTKATNVLAVGGAFEVDGATRLDGALTAYLGAAVTGATVDLNASSNFGVNVATGTSTGAVAIGGGSGTVAIDSTVWDVTTAGVVSGLGDVTFATGLAGGADIASATAAADTAGQTTDVLGQTGGAASADQVGKNGGAVTITAGAGSAKNGAGATDGDGGDVVLLGGAKGGATGGTEVDGIVRVGSPTVGSTKATNLLAVGGGLEVDGTTQLDGVITAGDGGDTVAINSSSWDVSTAGAVSSIGDITAITALAGGWDLGIATAADNTAAGSLDVTGQAGGAATGDGVGRAGGTVTLTGGVGSAKAGAGANDGDGGDLVLLGGARGGATAGTEVHGIVRVGSPTVGTTKATNMLAVEGAFEVDGTARFDGAATFNGTVAGPAEGKVVYNALHDVTIAEINAGHTIVTVPAAQQFRLVDVTAIAYGGACAAVTTVDLKAGAVFLATYAQANLTQSTQLRTDTAGVTMLADGASFTAQTAGDDVTVIKAGADVTTCTGVRFVLSYTLE